MRALQIILGILLIIGGISCMGTPLLTFVGAGYFLVIMLLVWGIYGVIAGIANKRYGFIFVYSIITLILALVILFVPGMRNFAGTALLIAMAFWFVIKGVLAIVASFKAKDVGVSSYGWGIFLGILDVIVGVYSFIHPFVLAMGIGILLAIYFVIAGIDLIVGKYTWI